MRSAKPFTWIVAALAAIAMMTAACTADDETTAAEEPASVEADDAMEESDGEAMDDEDHDDAEGDEDSMEDDAMEESEDEAMADESTGDFPVDISSAAGDFTLEDAPQSIVSLSPSSTELLFAMGAGDQVVAVDAFSNYPPEAPVTDLSGWDPNVEAVLGYEPDLVVIANDANDLVAGLTEVGVPVYIHAAPADIESGYAGVADLGVATGQIDGAADVVANMRTDMEAALAEAPDADVRIYHELDETYFSASSAGFIGSIYAAMGATNIADEADPDGTGFPQLTEEYIVEADPQVIVITDQVAYTPEDVAARPGWGDVSAVANGNVVVVNADIASRWGPRLPQFVTAVTEALNASSAVSG